MQVEGGHEVFAVAVAGGEVVDATIQGLNSLGEAVSASAASVSELGKRGEPIGQIIESISAVTSEANEGAKKSAEAASQPGSRAEQPQQIVGQFETR